MRGGEAGIKFFIAQAIPISFIEQSPVVIAALPGFITEVEVKHAIKGGTFTGNVVMNSIKIRLHINCVSDFTGIATTLPSCFSQDEWSVLKSEVIEGVAKQRFIGNQDL